MGVVTPVEYVRARTVLLDALDALGEHRDAVVLVGAQAVYLHSGDADLRTAPSTTDADLALAPDGLAGRLPAVEDAMCAAGFVPGAQPGIWLGRGHIAVDLLVPAAVSGPGGRRDQPGRLKPKDGLDVLRLLRTTDADLLGTRLVDLMADPMTNAIVTQAVDDLRTLADAPDALLPTLAAKAEEGFDDPDVLAMSVVVLVGDVLDAVAARDPQRGVGHS